MKNFNKLFDEFPQTSTKDWKEQISKDLKSEDAFKKLSWNTIDSFDIKPFYREEDISETVKTNPGEFPFKRGNNAENNSWKINQDFNSYNIENILRATENGVNSIGISWFENSKLDELSNKIRLENIAINNTNHKNTAAFINAFKDKNITGSAGYNAIGLLAITGNTMKMDELPELLETVIKSKSKLKVIDINGYYFNNAGSSIVQELAFSLSEAVEYISFLTDKGFKIDDIANKLQFKLSIGSDYFLEIAKFRAARYLWARIIESYSPADISSSKMFIHAVTSNWNKTIYDPYVNLLRTTTEAMSGIIGGIDSLTILPFDSNYKDENDFSTRLAKNQQLVLKEEAYLDKVIDPAEGSYYIETITESIIKECWKLFLEIESHGGFIKSFKADNIQNLIKAVAWRRDEDIETGKKVFIGTNKFPMQGEEINRNIDWIKHPLKDDLRASGPNAPLWNYRGAATFELLRFNNEENSKKIKVFLFTYGNPVMRKARAGFASNFFACAGYEIMDNIGFDSIEEGIKATLKSKADITVICSSDDEYPEIVPAITFGLKGKTELVIAGYPKEHIAKFKELGITDFIHVKSNIFETLNNFQSKLNEK